MHFPAGWTTSADGKRVSIAVKTEDFVDAIDLFEEIAEIAEELEHHPDLHLESYQNVRIESYSHDVGTLTDRDAQLVARIHLLLKARHLAP